MAIGQLRFNKVLRLSVLVSVAVLCCTWQAAGSNNRCVDQLPFGETKGKNFLQVDRKYRNKCSCSTSQFYMAFRFLFALALRHPPALVLARWLSSNTSSTSWGKASPISWRCHCWERLMNAVLFCKNWE